jgi:peptide-methionine (S)-S-oxide reductase
MKTIILAGGCFWGVEAYFQQLKGVLETSTGYVDGNKKHPTYKEVCDGTATHAEAVRIVYDETIITLEKVLDQFFRIINPYTKNRQGHDIGKQYRTGIYYDDDNDLVLIKNFMTSYFKDLIYRVQTEVKPNLDYELAEAYHQEYLKKNPGGYCHIDLGLAKKDEVKS